MWHNALPANDDHLQGFESLKSFSESLGRACISLCIRSTTWETMFWSGRQQQASAKRAPSGVSAHLAFANRCQEFYLLADQDKNERAAAVSLAVKKR